MYDNFADVPSLDPHFQQALDEIQAVMARHHLAGACLLLSPREAAWTYDFGDWSSIRRDPKAALGIRIEANAQQEGKLITQRRLDMTAYIMCMLEDFGAQTFFWFHQAREALEAYGLRINYKRFSGHKLPGLSLEREAPGVFAGKFTRSS